MSTKLKDEHIKIAINLALIAAAAVVLYGLYKGFDKVADLFGKGSEGGKADDKEMAVRNREASKNAWLPDYNYGLKNPKLLTNVEREYLFKQINTLLSTLQTYRTPLSYEKNRKTVIASIKRIIKTKSQLSDLAKTFSDRGYSLFDTVTKGYRDTGWTSGSGYEKMYSDLLSYIEKLPQ